MPKPNNQARFAALVASMVDGKWRQLVLSYDSTLVDAGMAIPVAVGNRLIGSGMVDVDRQHSVSLHGTRYTYVRLNARGIECVRKAQAVMAGQAAGQAAGHP